MESNHPPNTTIPTKPYPEVPHLHVFLNTCRDGDSTPSLGSLFLYERQEAQFPEKWSGGSWTTAWFSWRGLGLSMGWREPPAATVALPRPTGSSRPPSRPRRAQGCCSRCFPHCLVAFCPFLNIGCWAGPCPLLPAGAAASPPSRASPHGRRAAQWGLIRGEAEGAEPWNEKKCKLR